MTQLPAPQYNIGTAQPFGKQQYCLGTGMYVGYLGDGGGADNDTALTNLEAHIGPGTYIECMMIGAGLGSVGTRLSTVGANNPRHIVMHYNGMPGVNSGSLAAAISGSYDNSWKADAAAIVASPFNTQQLTMAPWWEGAVGGNGNFAWAIGNGTNTAAQFVAAWRRMWTTFHGVAGFSSAITWDWNVWTQKVNPADADAAYPGDAYVDIIGWDGYAGNYTGNLSIRGDYQTVWNQEQKPSLDQLTAFARTHGKMAGMGEYGQIQPIPGDTTSNTYKYSSTAPNNLYYPLMRDYVKANADVWAYLCLFNQNQKSGSNLTTEEDQLFFCGTDPATQNSSYYHSTSATSGTWYDTIAPQQQIPLASYRATMIAGTMQLPDPVVPAPATAVAQARADSVYNYYAPLG